MPTKRRRIAPRRLRYAAEMPAAVRWWLSHGFPLTLRQAYGFDFGDHDAWQISNLAFDRPVASGWTRAALRELGFGAAIDAHIEVGRCAPDRERRA